MHNLLASGDFFDHGQGHAVSLSASGDQVSQDLDPSLPPTPCSSGPSSGQPGIWFCPWTPFWEATFGDNSGATAVSCLSSSGSRSNNLKFNSPKQRTPNLEPPLLVYGVQSQAGIPPILPRQWKTNNHFEAGPGSCSPYRKLKAKPSISQSNALPLSDSAVSVRNLKIQILALPNIPAAKERILLLRGHSLFGKMLVIPIARVFFQSCQEMSTAMAAGATEHRQNTVLCLWVSLTWLHSSPWSVLLDSGQKDEMWLSCWDALHRLEAPVPLCFFYCHLISFPPFSEVQRRSLLHTREADKVLKGLQTFIFLVLRAKPGSVRKLLPRCKAALSTLKKTQPLSKFP